MGSVVKKSISVPDHVWREAETAAAEEHTTVSAFIAEAIENMIRTRDGLRAVREWERENGALTAEELAEADAILDAAEAAAKQ